VLKKSSTVQRKEADINNQVGNAIKKQMQLAMANKRQEAENNAIN
jgi:hypothetical protein